MPTPGPRTTYRYTSEFKATAVRLSALPGGVIQDVAESLAIHPFMLSRWRKQAREGLIVTRGVAVDKDITADPILGLSSSRKLIASHCRRFASLGPRLKRALGPRKPHR